jgi:hypothetical protein
MSSSRCHTRLRAQGARCTSGPACRAGRRRCRSPSTRRRFHTHPSPGSPSRSASPPQRCPCVRSAHRGDTRRDLHSVGVEQVEFWAQKGRSPDAVGGPYRLPAEWQARGFPRPQAGSKRIPLNLVPRASLSAPESGLTLRRFVLAALFGRARQRVNLKCKSSRGSFPTGHVQRDSPSPLGASCRPARPTMTSCQRSGNLKA